ncbi:EAL domain-containing protein [Clostridium carnis]
MDIFIARQAIYDKSEKVIGYELLYRSSLENSFDSSIEANKATYKVIENISSFGLDELTNNKIALVNFSEEVINSNIATLLPKEKVVIEVLEDVKPTKEILENLKILKRKGYRIALDDVVNLEQTLEFIDVIDIIKVDFMLSTKNQRKELSDFIVKTNIKLLAEKIETDEDLHEAIELGFEYFQGYYYSKPSVLFGKDVVIKNSSIFSILVELLKDDFDMDIVENIIKSDVALMYKFLRFINSSYFNFLQEISSIKQAIMLIGRGELKKWISILSIVEMASYKNAEYANNTVIRAKFCEVMLEEISSEEKSMAFMVGLFSDLHLMIEKDMRSIVDELPVSIDIKKALLGEENIYKQILDIALAYEKMDMTKINSLCKKVKLDTSILGNLYLKSIEWTKNITNIN